MSRITAIIIAVIACIIVSLTWLVGHYRDNATDYKRQRDEKVLALNKANASINEMLSRQRDIAALDAKYTQELANAQETINQLERDVATGKRRLQLNARCATDGKTISGSMGDASIPRLTDSAQRDYFTLRERITTVTKQVGYLQNYIKEQCLK